MLKAKTLTMAAIGLTGLLAVACGPANNAASDVSQAANQVGNTARNAGNAVGNTAPRGTHPVDRHVQVETKVAKRIDAVSGVNGATVLLANRTAYVGIGLGRNVSDSRQTQIKKEVVAVTKKADPSVQHVYVSADPGAVHQMQTFAGEVNAGHPVRGTWDRFQSMVNRIWPHHG